jgi:hypothetical protein
MSDTPRTDAETWRDEMDHVDTDYTFAQSITVYADFARQLERELAEATKQRDILVEALERFDVDWTLEEGEETTMYFTYEDQHILRTALATKGGCNE